MRHCWESGPPACIHDPECEDECPEGMSTTCILEVDDNRRHEGDHVWSRDDQIEIRFSKENP